MSAAIVLDDVSRHFGDVRAVDGLSLTVEPGEVVGLLGHNGAGKTTTIRLVNGLYAPTAGNVRVFDMDPTTRGEEVRRRTGVLTEYPALDDWLTGRENLRVYGAIHGIAVRELARRTDVLVDRLGLSEHADQPTRDLSAGLKQRVALARALLHEPDVLLLDEPTSNLDPVAARGVRELVRDLARDRGRSILVSTHNLVEAQALCDRVVIMEHGRCLAEGTVTSLAARADEVPVHLRVHPDHLGRTMAAFPDAEQLAGDVLAIRRPPAAVPQLVRELVQHGIDVQAVTPQAPTLEDVYLGLHDNRVAAT